MPLDIENTTIKIYPFDWRIAIHASFYHMVHSRVLEDGDNHGHDNENYNVSKKRPPTKVL